METLIKKVEAEKIELEIMKIEADIKALQSYIKICESGYDIICDKKRELELMYINIHELTKNKVKIIEMDTNFGDTYLSRVDSILNNQNAKYSVEILNKIKDAIFNEIDDKESDINNKQKKIIKLKQELKNIKKFLENEVF